MKIVFSIINGLLVILALMYFMLIFQIGNSESLALPGFILLLFAFNTLSIWYPFNLWIGALQFFLTLIIIPIIHLIFAISLPVAVAVAKIDNPQFDTEQYSKAGWILYIFSTLVFLSTLNIAYLAYQDRKKVKI